MKRCFLALTLLVPAALAAPLGGCATTGISATASAQLNATKGFAAAQTAFDAAVQTSDMAIKSGQLSTATVAAIKADVDKGYTYVVAGRTAVTSANSTGLVSATSLLTTLVTDLTTLAKG